MPDKCPWCGAGVMANFDYLYDCQSSNERYDYGPKQSNACRIRELEAKLAAAVAENAELEQIVDNQRELLQADERRVQSLCAGMAAAKGAITEDEYWQHMRVFNKEADRE